MTDPIETAREHLAQYDGSGARSTIQMRVLAEDVRALLGLLDEQSAVIMRGYRTHPDGSLSPVERWVRAADGDWISLDSTRRTSGDILITDAGVNAGPDVPTAQPGSDGADDAPDEAKGAPRHAPAPASAYPHDDETCRRDSVDADGFRDACREFGRIAEALGLPDVGLSIGEVADVVVERLAAQPESTTRAKAEAVRAVRDKWQWGAWIEAPKGGADDDPMQRLLAHGQYVTDWLTERANEIEAGDES